MTRPNFNLVDEPWIPCLMGDGQMVERSLLEVLSAPRDIREVVDPSPLVTMSLHRLMLAVLHRALGGPQDEEEWSSWWKKGCWPIDPVKNYLQRWRHRFDLFDPEHPFYQDPSAEKYADDSVRLATELASSFNASLLFDQTKRGSVMLTPGAAARYLIAYQAFSVGGLLSAKARDARSSKSAPLWKLAVCLGKGENLAQTLILNLLPPRRGRYKPPSDLCRDLPAWERAVPPGDGPRWPCGYVDYLTWQARRVLLRWEWQHGRLTVPSAVIQPGERFPEGFEQHQLETMVPFRRDAKRGWVALTYSEERALWRDSLALLQTISPGGEGWDRPEIVSWWSRLACHGALDRFVQPVDVAGFVTKTNQAKPLFWRYERFPLPLPLLGDEDRLRELSTMLSCAEEAAETLRQHLGELARNLGVAAEVRSDFVRSLGAERLYWSALEPRFYPLLERLAREPQDFASVRYEWGRMVQSEARRAFEAAAGALMHGGRRIFEIARIRSSFSAALAKMLSEKGIIPTDEEVSHVS